MKTHLKNAIIAIINEDNLSAKEFFHDYMIEKMKHTLQETKNKMVSVVPIGNFENLEDFNYHNAAEKFLTSVSKNTEKYTFNHAWILGYGKTAIAVNKDDNTDQWKFDLDTEEWQKMDKEDLLAAS